MPDYLLTELFRCAPTLLSGGLRGLAQARDPFKQYEKDFGNPYDMPESEPFPIGALIVGALVLIGLNVMFGFWGKSRAEKHNVDPWIGFTLGFVLQFIGVAMVPVFRRDRILNRQPQPLSPQQMNAPNPMYAPAGGYALPSHAMPPVNAANPVYAPAVHSFNPVPGYGVPHPPPRAPLPSPPQMLVADATGYVVCPGCAARTKTGRKTCMSCGYQLPTVFDPNLK